MDNLEKLANCVYKTQDEDKQSKKPEPLNANKHK